MPMINIEDAYILDETGAQVDQVTGLYFKNENASETEKAQARANIGAGGTNENLLDNAYFVGGGSQLGDGIFPINQRGQVSYGTSMYTVDRWRTWSDMAVGVTASGLSLTSTNSGGGLFQYPQQSKVANAIGQQMTFSVELNGTIYSATGQVYLGAWIPIDIPIQGVSAIFVVPNNYPSELISVSVRMDGAISTPVLFTRAKLEVGTVSTLANDAPPDFGEELRKCQRYLWQKTFPQYTQIGIGVATDASNCVVDIVLPASMRTGAIITFTANVLLIGAGGALVAASVSAINIIDNHARLNVIAASSMVVHNTYSFITSTDTIMTISAEI